MPVPAQVLELGERLGELAADDFLAVYLQPLKEALVEQPPFLRPGLPIGGLNVCRQIQRQVERIEHLVVLDIKGLDPLLGRGPLPADALLLVGEQALAHLVGVVGLQQLALLLLQPLEAKLGFGHPLGG